MKKIIFALLPIDYGENNDHTFQTYKGQKIQIKLKELFADTFSEAKKTIHCLFERIGLPQKQAEIYKASIYEGKNVIAAIVSLEMEDHVRRTFHKLQATTISTINCP